MSKIGLVGGVGWPATALYYDALCRAAAPVFPGGSPPMTIESLDMRGTMAARGIDGDDDSWAGFDMIFRDAVIRLGDAGCSVAGIASVTPHIRLEAIRKGLTLPVVSIVEATISTMLQNQVTAARVLATPMILKNGLFDAAVARAGVASGTPLPVEAIAEFGDILEEWFYPGNGEAGRGALVDFAKRAVANSGTTTIVLACTDLAAAFPEHQGKELFDAEGLTWVNAAETHVKALLLAAGYLGPEENGNDRVRR